jgi:hypothetical protein
MAALRRSNDRKVAADVTDKGGIKIANAFGLPSGKAFSCPGATSVCEKVCYAGKLEKIYKGVRNVMVANWDALQGLDEEGMFSLLHDMISEFDSEVTRKNGTPSFRIHWDGDFFSLAYAQAWARVVKAFPHITFWAYTRTFTPALNVVPTLAGIPNLALYLSVDRDNLTHAKDVRKAYKGVRWAFLGDTAASTKDEMITLTGKPGAICPENVKRIELITPEGGACIRCDLCVKGKADVRFAIAKK